MQTYSTIPAVEDAPLAAPAKSETPNRKAVATIAAICFASAVAGTAAPSAARGVASFVASSSSTYTQIQVTHAPGAKTHGMGWDELENSSRVIATRCFEDRDPYDAQIYWKIL
jgi:hypothetical protein